MTMSITSVPGVNRYFATEITEYNDRLNELPTDLTNYTNDWLINWRFTRVNTKRSISAKEMQVA